MRRTKSVASCYPSLVEVLGRGRRQRNATSLSRSLRRKPLHRHSDDLIRARRRPKNPRPLPMIPPFVILRCVLPYPFVHSDKRLRSLWKKDACGDDTPNHKNSIRPLGSDYTRCYAENASPTTPFCRRKMRKPPISRRPALQSRQALDAVPIAYVDTRHRCRAIDAGRQSAKKRCNLTASRRSHGASPRRKRSAPPARLTPHGRRLSAYRASTSSRVRLVASATLAGSSPIRSSFRAVSVRASRMPSDLPS